MHRNFTQVSRIIELTRAFLARLLLPFSPRNFSIFHASKFCKILPREREFRRGRGRDSWHGVTVSFIPPSTIRNPSSPFLPPPPLIVPSSASSVRRADFELFRREHPRQSRRCNARLIKTKYIIRVLVTCGHGAIERSASCRRFCQANTYRTVSTFTF